MAKIYYDGDKIVNRVVPSIKDTITSVSNAATIANNISIPSGFYYYNTLKKTITEINDIKKDLNEIHDWLVESDKKINNSIEKVSNMFNAFETIDFDVRKNMIKNGDENER